jgi:hypothetical protein
VKNETNSTSLTGGAGLPPDFKQIRKYLRTIEQREALGLFIKAGWTPAELAEYARQMYLVPGQRKPTAASYQFVVEKGPEHLFAREILARLRAPGYVMLPFDRPVPKRFSYDDPDSPDHTSEIRADVVEIAKLYRNRQADWSGRCRVEADTPIPRWLWKRCYRLRNRYHSLEDTIEIQGLRDYA